MSRIEVALDYIQRYAGTWYLWGGDNPEGFDCSGLVVEYLKSLGVLMEREDLTAEGVRKSLQETAYPRRGGVAFKMADGVAVHTGVLLSDTQMLTASGGCSNIRTIAAAMKADAFIKVRTVSKSDYVFALPTKARELVI